MNIDQVVFWELFPKSYTRVEPFSVTIHFVELSLPEKALIQDAIVNAAHEIRRRRNIDGDPFYNVYPSDNMCPECGGTGKHITEFDARYGGDSGMCQTCQGKK